MHLNRNKLVTSAGALTASALPLLTVPTGATEATSAGRQCHVSPFALRCIPVGSGFCPGSTDGLDWNNILRRLEVSDGWPDRANLSSAHPA